MASSSFCNPDGSTSNKRRLTALRHVATSAVLYGLVILSLQTNRKGLRDLLRRTNRVGSTSENVPALTTVYQHELAPLESLCKNTSIVGNVSSLLDFAILGFAKCGTTTLSHWLDSHAEMEGVPGESWALMGNDPLRLSKWLWMMKRKNIDSENFTHSPLPKQFYKQPKDAYTPHVLKALDTYWPNTGLIYTLRHPVEWFESYWNFRHGSVVQEIPGSVVGRKGNLNKLSFKIHTGLGEYHTYMAMLGKTNQTSTAEEWSLIESFLGVNDSGWYPFPKIQNKVFFIESKQLSDKNSTRSIELRRDLSRFLHLSTVLPEIPHIQPETLWLNETQLADRKRNRVNICQEEYLAIRAELLRVGTAASTWLRKYFMKADDVFFSSGPHLEELLETWSIDPCIDRLKKMD